MSFDLCVFYTTKPLTNEKATERYIAYCEEENLSAYIEPSSNIKAFVSDLATKYPQIDDVAESDLELCPWSCAFDVSDGHAIIPMRLSKAIEAGGFIVELAAKHGLVCYDPQAEKIQYAPRGINKSEKPWWKIW